MRKFEGCNVEYNGDNQLFLENLIVKCEYSMPMLIEQSLAMSGHISTIEFMLPTYYVKQCIPAKILNRFGDVDPNKGVYIIRKPVFDQRDTSCYIIEDGVEKRILKDFANASLFEYYYLVVDDVDRNAILHVARKDCFTGVIEFLSDVKYYDMFSNPYVFLSCAYVYAATHYCYNIYSNPNDRYSSGRSRSGRLLVRGGCPLPANEYVESMLYYCNSRGQLSTQSDIIE